MANRYWVGGTATWDGTAGTKWALTSGGAGGQAVPTSSDTVFFDANSGANTVTIGSGTAVCSTLTMTGFTGTLAFGSNSITISGNNNNIFVGATTFSTTGTPVINCNYSGSTGTRAIAAGAMTEANAISFNVTAGSDIVNPTGSYKNLNFTGFSGSIGSTTKILYGSLTLSSTMTSTDGANTTNFNSTLVQQNITTNGVTLGGSLTIGGTQTVQLQAAVTLLSSRTVTLTSGTLDLNSKTLTVGQFISSNTNTRSIAFGTGSITLTGNAETILSCPTTTNLTYTGTPTINCTYSGSTGTRGINTSTATSFIPNINVTAGSDNVNFASGNLVGSVNFIGFTGTYTNIQISVYGNWTYGTGMTTVTGTGTIGFTGTSGTQQITTNGVVSNFQMTVNGGSTVQLQDNLTIDSTHQLALTLGTLDANNKNVSVGIFNSNNSNVRTLLMGSGTWTLTGTGNVWNIVTSTNITLTPSTSTIVFNGSGIGTFFGGGKTYYNLTQSSSNALTLQGTNTFNTISNTVQPTTITFTANTTQTVTNFNVNGTAGNLVTINSTSAGTQGILTSPSYITNTVSYVSLQDNNATGGTWYAPSNQGNTIASNVTGWMTSALYFEGITEAGSASDLQNESMATNSVITELGSATDTQSESMSAPANISELGNALDTQSESLNAPTTISEAGNAQDNVFQTLTAYCVISEAGNAQDIQLEAMSALLSIIESGLASDTVSQQLIGYASVAENGNALDTVTENMRATVSIVEAGSAQDFLSEAVIAPVNMFESGNAQDTQSEKVYVYIAIIENGNAIDVYYCKPIFNTSEKIWHVLPRRDYWHAND